MFAEKIRDEKRARRTCARARARRLNFINRINFFLSRDAALIFQRWEVFFRRRLLTEIAFAFSVSTVNRADYRHHHDRARRKKNLHERRARNVTGFSRPYYRNGYFVIVGIHDDRATKKIARLVPSTRDEQLTPSNWPKNHQQGTSGSEMGIVTTIYHPFSR